MHNFLRHTSLISAFMTISCFTLGFSAWTFGDENVSVLESITLKVSTADINVTTYTFSSLALSENTTLSTSSIEFYSYQQVGTLDSEGNYSSVEDSEVSYAFSSNVVSVVMDLDKNSDTFDNAPYDSSDFYAVSVEISVYDDSGIIEGASQYFQAASLRPYNLPNYEFAMDSSSNVDGMWYIPIKSSSDMSLYAIFGYDYSWKSLSTEEKKVPVEFCFEFDNSKLAEAISLISTGNISFSITFMLVTYSDYGK